MRRALQVACLVLLLVAACEDRDAALAAVQQSHIAANAAAPADFDRILDRDLTTYFAGLKPGAGKLNVTREFLRQGPTQSGVSTPKYYLWVVATVDGASWREGAVRVAASGGDHFTVTNFLTREELTADPEAATRLFPKPVVERILDHLRP